MTKSKTNTNLAGEKVQNNKHPREDKIENKDKDKAQTEGGAKTKMKTKTQTARH
jgi:hypothetical protein